MNIKTILKIGMQGLAVTNLQNRLIQLGFTLLVDGVFGKVTESIVKQFQKDNGLFPDGVVGPKTIEALSTEPVNVGKLNEAMVRVADDLGIELAVLKAVREVESSGNGFLKENTPIILFERHWMYKGLKQRALNPQLYSKIAPNVVNTKSGGYMGMEKEWARLKVASGINEDAALEATSWGAYQIMGFHWASLGFDSVQSFVKKMSEDRSSQLEIFGRFIEWNPLLLKYLRELDFKNFARIYNGPKYYKNKYDVKLEQSYNKFKNA